MEHDHNNPPEQQNGQRPKNRPPADVLRDGSLKATIWENEGEKGVYHSTTLAKTFEDKSGKLRDTHSFSSSDLLRVSELARQAYVRSNQLYREHKNEREGNDRGARRDEYRGRRATANRSNGRSAARSGDQYPEPPR